MKILKIIFICLFINFFLSSFSQESSNKPGNVEVIQDIKLTELLEKHLYYSQNFCVIQGYRIQIYFDSGNNSKKGAMAIKATFITKYPDVEAYIIFQEPYYKVRVGDFRTRMEAEGFLEKIIADFPNAYRVNDKIKFPKCTN